MTNITTLVHWVYQYATGGPKKCRPAIATQIDPPQPGDTGERLWLTVFHPFGMRAESIPLGTPHRPWAGADTPMGSWHHADEHQEQT